MISTINGNALSIPLPDKAVQCVITSPPYWGLRDYGVSGQIGLESTPQAYVVNIVAVMRECWRVMRDDATLWLVIGDSYAGNGAISQKQTDADIRHATVGNALAKCQRRIGTVDGLKPKDLVGIPWRVAFALQDDGWYLRSDIIWHKPNPMPESVTDRPTKAHEYVFLLAKQERYFYDSRAIAELSTWADKDKRADGNGKHLSKGKCAEGKYSIDGVSYGNKNSDGTFSRNRRSVWTISTRPYSGAHFATFPPALVEPMILAGSRFGDIVLDPFAGTSTVGRVCAKHGRKFIGIELNPAYIELAKNRTSGVQIVLSACAEIT